MSEEFADALYESITIDHHDYVVHCLRITDEEVPVIVGLELVGEEVWIKVVRNAGLDSNEDDIVYTYPRSQAWVVKVLELAEKGTEIIWA